MIKNEFTADIFEHIEERISDYANGDVWYTCDLVTELTMYENNIGAWIIGTYKASEYIRNHWDEASDAYEWSKDNLGYCPNPFDNPEEFTFFMLAYGVETLCTYSETLNDYSSDQIRLTRKKARRIVKELDEVQDLRPW